MSHSSVHHHSWISLASTFHILMCFWGPWWLVGDNFRIDLPSRRKGSMCSMSSGTCQQHSPQRKTYFCWNQFLDKTLCFQWADPARACSAILGCSVSEKQAFLRTREIHWRVVSVKQSKLVKILEEVKLVNLVSLVEQVMVAFKDAFQF